MIFVFGQQSQYIPFTDNGRKPTTQKKGITYEANAPHRPFVPRYRPRIDRQSKRPRSPQHPHWRGYEGVAFKTEGSIHKVGVRKEDLGMARAWLAGAYKNHTLKRGISLR